MAALRRLFGRPKILAVGEPPNVTYARDPYADHPIYCKCYFHR